MSDLDLLFKLEHELEPDERDHAAQHYKRCISPSCTKRYKELITELIKSDLFSCKKTQSNKYWFMEYDMSPDTLEYNESDVLTTIDGFAITTEETINITLRSTLSANQKLEGILELTNWWTEHREPAVHLWSIDDK